MNRARLSRYRPLKSSSNGRGRRVWGFWGGRGGATPGGGGAAPAGRPGPGGLADRAGVPGGGGAPPRPADGLLGDRLRLVPAELAGEPLVTWPDVPPGRGGGVGGQQPAQ